MRSCTYSSMRTGHCRERASVRLSWSRSITQGWDVNVARVYCPTHGGEVLANLNGLGTAVTVETLDVERPPIAVAPA